MWLKVLFEEHEDVRFTENPGSSEISNMEVSLSDEKIAPIDSSWKTFRLSPIFPLIPDIPVPLLNDGFIYFLHFKNAYRALGRIDKKAKDNFKAKIFFSCGLCSIILITSDKADFEELRSITGVKENACEIWQIQNEKVIKIDYLVEKNREIIPIQIEDYSALPLTQRSLIDEFSITIKLLLLKLTTHMPFEIPKIQSLINEVNILVKELLYLNQPKDSPPDTIKEFSAEELKVKKINQAIQHQNTDRIIQINSALSYVSTQAFSGAIPILERRSLIRRNSLLGIGSSILALNNIARYIENSFSELAIDQVITNQFVNWAPLPGLSNSVIYDSSEWHEGSINKHSPVGQIAQGYLKLPYFSGRLGFRESEYSIAAAIQSISSGATLEWSLMTITHEMLHGHVRTIINALFYGDDETNYETQRHEYYEKYKSMVLGNSKNDKLIDSIRAIIFSYCCQSTVCGSLTFRQEFKGDKYKIPLLSKDDIWSILAQENRNLNELFVHVLDLNYFYGNNLSLYIPLVWSSWIAVPHVNGDVRQYILRSLLTIASKSKSKAYQRFLWSVEILEELLTKYSKTKLGLPIIHDVLKILADKEELKKNYLPAFGASLIIVDLVNGVFISSSVRSKFFQDQFVQWAIQDEQEDSFEQSFQYLLPPGFNDEIIASPLAYLLDKTARLLDSNGITNNIERETALEFLALNSTN